MATNHSIITILNSLKQIPVQTSVNLWIERDERQTVDVDVLAASCAWQRIRRSTDYTGFNGTLISKSLQSLVEEQDLVRARAIREYYEKKLIVWKLGGRSLSKFRQDLEQALQSNPREYIPEFSGMIFRLPEFHDYDMNMESLCDQEFVSIPDGTPKTVKKEMSLVPLKQVSRRTTGKCLFEYWFKEQSSSFPVVVRVEHNNSLLGLWDLVFNLKQPLNIQGNFIIEHWGHFAFYNARGWNLNSSLSISN